MGIDEDSGEVGIGNDGFFGCLFKFKKFVFLDEDILVMYLCCGYDIVLEGEVEFKFDEFV